MFTFLISLLAMGVGAGLTYYVVSESATFVLEKTKLDSMLKIAEERNGELIMIKSDKHVDVLICSRVDSGEKFEIHCEKDSTQTIYTKVTEKPFGGVDEGHN